MRSRQPCSRGDMGGEIGRNEAGSFGRSAPNGKASRASASTPTACTSPRSSGDQAGVIIQLWCEEHEIMEQWGKAECVPRQNCGPRAQQSLGRLNQRQAFTPGSREWSHKGSGQKKVQGWPSVSLDPNCETASIMELTRVLRFNRRGLGCDKGSSPLA